MIEQEVFETIVRPFFDEPLARLVATMPQPRTVRPREVAPEKNGAEDLIGNLFIDDEHGIAVRIAFQSDDRATFEDKTLLVDGGDIPWTEAIGLLLVLVRKWLPGTDIKNEIWLHYREVLGKSLVVKSQLRRAR